MIRSMHRQVFVFKNCIRAFIFKAKDIHFMKGRYIFVELITYKEIVDVSFKLLHHFWELYDMNI